MAKSDVHLIACEFKRVSEKLGRTPTRDEFVIESPFSKRTIEETFGSYTALLQSCGAWERGHKRQNKEAIRKETFEHVQKEIQDKSKLIIPPKISSSHLFISDPHKPNSHPDFYPFLFALDDKYKFDRVTLGGDEIDAHGFSFHDHDPDLLSPGHELELAIKMLQPLYERWPEVDVLESNHGSMVYRKGKHHGLPRHVLKSYNDVLCAPKGWVWHEELEVQFSNGKKALVHHGYSPNILLASQKRAMSLIQFHFHSKFSIQYWANLSGMYFAMQCGCMINDKSAAFAYNRLTLERPIIGVGAVFDGLPRLFPMLLNSQGRWTGVVP